MSYWPERCRLFSSLIHLQRPDGRCQQPPLPVTTRNISIRKCLSWEPSRVWRRSNTLKATLEKNFPGLARPKLLVKNREIHPGQWYGRELLKRGQTLRRPPSVCGLKPEVMASPGLFVRNASSPFELVLMRWRKLEPIIQGEVSQKEKHQHSILMHIYGI